MRSAAFSRFRHSLRRSRLGRSLRRGGKYLILTAITLLALAALMRMLAALVEALTLCILALVVAALVLPRHWRRQWQDGRRQMSAWLLTAAQSINVPPPAETETSTGQDHTAETEASGNNPK